MTSEGSGIDLDAAAAALRRYRQRLPEGGELRPVARPGFSGAVVLRLETAAGPFCLRGWPTEIDFGLRIVCVHEFLAYVHGRGIDYVAVPIESDEKTTLIQRAGRCWQIEPWLPGRADFWSMPSDTRLVAAFHALARFHEAARGFVSLAFGPGSQLAPARPGVATPTVLDRIVRIDRWSPDRLAELKARIGRASGEREANGADITRTAGASVHHCERHRSRVAEELRAAAQTTVPLQPCLRDVWHDHVLFVGDAVTGLIDPSAARTDTVAADISRLAGSLFGDDRPMWAKALDAYRSIRPLSAAEIALCDVLDRSGVLLSAMTWLQRRYFDGIRLSEAAIDRFERIATRLADFSR